MERDKDTRIQVRGESQAAEGKLMGKQVREGTGRARTWKGVIKMRRRRCERGKSEVPGRGETKLEILIVKGKRGQGR